MKRKISGILAGLILSGLIFSDGMAASGSAGVTLDVKVPIQVTEIQPVRIVIQKKPGAVNTLSSYSVTVNGASAIKDDTANKIQVQVSAGCFKITGQQGSTVRITPGVISGSGITVSANGLKARSSDTACPTAGSFYSIGTTTLSSTGEKYIQYTLSCSACGFDWTFQLSGDISSPGSYSITIPITVDYQ